ncbi:hypothetical protein [Desulfosarcina sp.]|uniref:hypothetical protein n=1 Tax=Desulfosarcina sp. TaxID=2027861 RepID=UPI003970D2A4
MVDPEGKPVGMWYSRRSLTTIRFEPDGVIAVSLPDPGSEPALMNRRPGGLH